MYDLGVDAVLELATMLGYAVGAVLFTGVGLFVEQTGLATLLSGGLSVAGVWEVGVGLVLVYAGVAYCGRELLVATRSE